MIQVAVDKQLITEIWLKEEMGRMKMMYEG